MEDLNVAPEGKPADNAQAPAPVAPAPAPVVPVVQNGFNIPQEYANEGCFNNYKNPDGTLNVDNLVKGFANQAKLVGKKTVMPDWNNPTEAEEFLTKFRPEDKSKYQLPSDLTPEQAEATSSMLHEAGLNELQAKKLTDLFFKDQANIKEEAYGIDTFKKLIGESFNNDENKISDIHNEVKSLFGEQFIDSTENKTLVEVYKVMAKIKEQYGVKELSANINSPSSMTGNSVADLNAKIAESRGRLDALSRRNHTADENKAELDVFNNLMTQKFRVEGRLK